MSREKLITRSHLAVPNVAEGKPNGQVEARPGQEPGRIMTVCPSGEYSDHTGNADIWTVDVSSAEMRRLTDDPAYDVNPVFSPDGSRIAFQSDRGGRLEVWIMDADGSSQIALTRNGVSGHFLRTNRSSSDE